MSTIASTPPEAARLRRPRWRDPRLLVGLVLVLASVAGVAALVSSSQRTASYWAAAGDLAPGTPVEAGHFVQVEANLGPAAGRYLSAEAPAPAGQVLSGVVRAGELVPARMLGDVDPQRRRPVGVDVKETLPAGVDVGDRVDVWVALPGKGGRGFGEPQRLAEGVEIAERAEEKGGLGGGPVTRLQLMVGEDVLPRLLDAKGKEARITVVPTLGAR